MLLPMFDKKNNLRDNFKHSLQSPYKVITYCNFLSRLITPYHTLSLMFDEKIISATTFNIVSSPLERYHISPHLVTSYHILLHLISMFDRK